MSEPYLIAHIVRGEPAFDIAILCTEDSGWGTYSDPAPWWIIPTSGHRAYPYWSIYMSELMAGESFDPYNLIYRVPPAPSSWPDHYSANDRARNRAIAEDMDLAKDAARPGEGQITNLAELLGFLPKAPTITRRR